MPDTSTPLPGTPTAASRTGRPVMALLDLLGRRWQLRLLWELRDGARLRFRALQDATGISPGVLNTRLRETVEAGIVELGSDGYVLTDRGKTLLALLLPLNGWAEDWAKHLRKDGGG